MTDILKKYKASEDKLSDKDSKVWNIYTTDICNAFTGKRFSCPAQVPNWWYNVHFCQTFLVFDIFPNSR